MEPPDWPKLKWTGYDGRIFLTETEWHTYLRRPPVRFPRRDQPVAADAICALCRRALEASGPLQLAHRIPFIRGVCVLALTPDLLDSDRNLVIAHRRLCNKEVELDLLESLRLLRQWGVTDLPTFLGPVVQDAWALSASSFS